MTTIVKATSKGQITLPAKWRKLFNTNQFLLKEKKGVLEIRPIDMEKLEEESGYTTIFSAQRDNNGKAVPINDFIEVLEKIA